MSRYRAPASQLRTFLAILSTIAIAGCASSPEQRSQLDDTIVGTTMLLETLTAANHIVSGGAQVARPPVRAPEAIRTGATGKIPAPTGYNQRESFEDCEKLYRAAGMPDQAAECARRAANMQSLTPPRR